MTQRVLELTAEVESDIHRMSSFFAWFKEKRINIRKVDMIEDTNDRTRCQIFLQLDCPSEDSTRLLQEINDRFESCPIT